MASIPARGTLRPLQPRRQPLQPRSLRRRGQIIDATSNLLQEVGIDDLTTIRIAQRLRISVGTLYHYFPNKQAILYAMGESWIADIEAALDQVQANLVGKLSPGAWVDLMTEKLLSVYQNQQSYLPLVMSMCSMPELRQLDRQHDQLVINRVTLMLRQFGVAKSQQELERIAQAYLKLNQALLPLAVGERGQRASRTLKDLKRLCLSLIEMHLDKSASFETKMR